MEINIPEKLVSNIQGYNFFANLAASTMLLTNEDVTINFSDCTFFEGNLCAVLGSILNGLIERKNSISFSSMIPFVKGVMSRNEFLNAFYETGEINSTSTPTIHYKRFNIEDENSVQQYIENELLNEPNLPSLSTMLKKQIVVSISEIYANAITHGNCDYVFACGQSFTRRHTPEILFTFVDLGKTIKNNVTEYSINNVIESLKQPISGKDAIIWATSETNSTKVDNHPGGLGLKIIQEFALQNEGKIQIISSNGFWEYHKGEVNTSDLTADFPGTIVNLIFNLNDKKIYFLTSEFFPTKNIF